MIRRAAVAVLLSTAALTAACSTTTTTPATVPTTARPAAEPTTLALGETTTLTRADTGARVGTIRWAAIEALPTDCIAGRRDGVTLAIRVEIVNGPGEQVPVPDEYQLQYLDGQGVARTVATASVYSPCEADYPVAETAAPGGTTEGWLTVRADGEPTELVYTPMVGDQTSTLGDIKVLTVSPSSVRVDVPDQLAHVGESSPVVPAPTTVAVPRTTAAPAPVAPPTGRDSQGRANGSGGALVGCADENYQPGTGIYADGSKGFAAECLPGGSMR